MPPINVETTKNPRRPTKPVSINPQVYGLLTEIAGHPDEDRPIKSQLERIIRDYYQRWSEDKEQK